MGEITWLVGPPGAGKSTYAKNQKKFKRVVELNEMLAPLVNPVRIRKGIRKANNRLIEIIRYIESEEDNKKLAPLLVVAGIVDKEKIFPLQEGESLWLLLPERKRWEKQLYKRPILENNSFQYNDYEYSEKSYNEFEKWETDQKWNEKCKRIDELFDERLSYNESFIGKNSKQENRYHLR